MGTGSSGRMVTGNTARRARSVRARFSIVIFMRSTERVGLWERVISDEGVDNQGRPGSSFGSRGSCGSSIDGFAPAYGTCMPEATLTDSVVRTSVACNSSAHRAIAGGRLAGFVSFLLTGRNWRAVAGPVSVDRLWLWSQAGWPPGQLKPALPTGRRRNVPSACSQSLEVKSTEPSLQLTLAHWISTTRGSSMSHARAVGSHGRVPGSSPSLGLPTSTASHPLPLIWVIMSRLLLPPVSAWSLNRSITQDTRRQRTSPHTRHTLGLVRSSGTSPRCG